MPDRTLSSVTLKGNSGCSKECSWRAPLGALPGAPRISLSPLWSTPRAPRFTQNAWSTSQSTSRDFPIEPCHSVTGRRDCNPIVAAAKSQSLSVSVLDKPKQCSSTPTHDKNQTEHVQTNSHQARALQLGPTTQAHLEVYQKHAAQSSATPVKILACSLDLFVRHIWICQPLSPYQLAS